MSMCERDIDRLPLEHPQLGTCHVTQACALTGNRTSNLSVCRLVLNPLSHTSQGIRGNFFKLKTRTFDKTVSCS